MDMERIKEDSDRRMEKIREMTEGMWSSWEERNRPKDED